MSGGIIISVRNLTARYDDRTVLDDISFDVRAGEICAVLGGSGCGKSTLLKHIMRLLEPAQGSIVIDGCDITTASGEKLLEARRKMGALFQSSALFSSMTLAENIGLPLQEYTQLPAALISGIIRFKLALVGLTGYEDYMPAELSGGMKKRAALARAMALDPQILLFDEMSAGLDPVTSAELDRLVLQMNRSLGLTIIVVTHELPSIMSIADHAIMLDKGKIIAEGMPEDLKNSRIKEVYAFFNRQARDVAIGKNAEHWTELFDQLHRKGDNGHG